MESRFVRSSDGTRIAYDRSGGGRPLVLLHGGFVHDRRSWHTSGYIERLRDRFFVLAIDLRGHGESERPDPGAPGAGFGAAAFVDDIHAVLDAEGIDRAPIWGYSLGAGVALQVGRNGRRASAIAACGGAFGRWLSDGRAAAWRARADSWAPGVDPALVHGVVAGLQSWPPVEPRDLSCATLLAVGSADNIVFDALAPYEAEIARSGDRVQRRVLDGLDHDATFTSVDRLLPEVVTFLRSLTVLD